MNMLSPLSQTLSSTVVARFNGTDEVKESSKKGKDPEIDRFAPIFDLMLQQKVDGGPTEFLFFTPDESNKRLGTYAWDDFCTSDTYGFTSQTDALIETAFEQDGLLELLPQNLKIGDNGPGTLSVFQQKTGAFIRRIQQSKSHEIQSLVVRDKSTRFATDAAFSGKRDYGINESIAVKSDFLNDETRFLEGQGTPVILTWGGPFANAPEFAGGPTALQYLEQTFHNMHKQHGLGSYFIIEIDLPNSKEDLLKSYDMDLSDKDSLSQDEVNKRVAFKNFVLGAFYRAAHNGTIKNEDYNVDWHWDAATHIDESTVTIIGDDGKRKQVTYPVVKLSATPKRAHSLKTHNGTTTSVSRSDAPRVQILSHKWSEAIWKHAARTAGADNIQFFRNGEKALMFGKFSHKLSA